MKLVSHTKLSTTFTYQSSTAVSQSSSVDPWYARITRSEHSSVHRWDHPLSTQKESGSEASDNRDNKSKVCQCTALWNVHPIRGTRVWQHFVLAIAIEGSSPSHSAKYPTQLEMDNLIPKDDDHIDWNTDPFEFANKPSSTVKNSTSSRTPWSPSCRQTPRRLSPLSHQRQGPSDSILQ